MSEQFPRGKLNEDDKGAIKIGVFTSDGTVIIQFFKSVTWIGMDRESALRFAATIVEHANSIKLN